MNNSNLSLPNAVREFISIVYVTVEILFVKDAEYQRDVEVTDMCHRYNNFFTKLSYCVIACVYK